MKSTGVVRRIDDLGRIVIPKEIRRTLKIRDGESLEIFVEKEAITLKKYSSSDDLADISQMLLDAVSTTTEKTLFVTDRDNFIVGSGELKKKFSGKMLSQELEQKLLEGEKASLKSVEFNQIVTSDEKESTKYNYFLSPILADGEILGLVIMIGKVNQNDIDTEDEKMVQIISQFLGKYLED